ncbi:sigma-70 family RNA polymerase sigma factor [Streptomyces sp. ISL-96]|uniref:sigma-70 family RNA polymerase sigma factor n=1 Tax=Streptomyces sp. ISL-96 TaxID=2819191 RepID=UPI0027E2273E|nr:sigma-70 family RNA polymerase sigma factor [Streptomyces sp. ISL-96]
MTADTVTDVFEQHRPVLTGVAYRMLGRVADAEDVVQEAWLRWSAQARDDVREPRAYLVRITTRLAIDRLRHVQARREAYVGPWLPEPLETDFGASVEDAAERAVLADSVSLAVLVVLESLSPLERAVFVLREAFGFPYGEIAATLERSESAVRQLAGRARRHVGERRPRFDVDPAERRDLTERFLAAASGGDLDPYFAGHPIVKINWSRPIAAQSGPQRRSQCRSDPVGFGRRRAAAANLFSDPRSPGLDALLALLAPDVRLVGDSGGKAKAPLRVIESADKVGRFLFGAARKGIPEGEFRFLEVNGGPALLVLSGGKPDSVFQLDVVDGLIQCIYIVRNPDKLTALAV